MSFIGLHQSDLQKVANICNQISPKKSDIEIFTFTKITVDKTHFSLSAMNANLFFQTTLVSPNSDISDKIEFLIQTDAFANIISLMTDDVVGLEIHLDKSTLVVQGAKTKHTLRINADKVTEFNLPVSNPETTYCAIEVKTSDIIAANKAAALSVGTPKTVYQSEFLHICYDVYQQLNQLNVVSTDRYRITKHVIPATFSHVSENFEQNPIKFLLHPKGLAVLTSSLDLQETVTFQFEQDYAWIRFGASEITLRYGEGKYPDYDRIVPQSFVCNFLVNTNDCLNALKQVYVSARGNLANKSIIMSVQPEQSKIVYSATSPDGFSSESSIDISNYEGVKDNWDQSFNAEYLLSYLNHLSAETFLWEANPGKPSVLSPENQKNTELYLVSGLK